MKLPYRLIACLLVSLAPAVGSYAQPVPSTPSEETIKLPQFTIEAPQNDTSLVGTQSTSTTRIAVDTFNLPTTVQVVGREFLNELNAQQISNIFPYIAGGQPGTASWTSGRFGLRGINNANTDGDFEDGFRINTQSNVDEFIFDRIEIISGANTTEQAIGPASGVPNKITKSPTAYSFAQASVTYGLFDAGAARIDAGGPITKDKKLQYRVIATQTDYHGYYDNTPFHRTLVAGMLKYQFSPDTQITVKQWGWKTYFPSYNPPTLDPNTYTYWPGLSYKRNGSEGKPFNWRKDRTDKTDFLLTSRLSPWAVFRLAAVNTNEQYSRVESVGTVYTANTTPIKDPANPAITYNTQPYSGEFVFSSGGTTFTGPWEPGVVGHDLIPRATTAQKNSAPTREIQSDFDFTVNVHGVSENLLVGGSFNDSPTLNWGYPGTSTPIDFYNKSAPTVTVNFANPSSMTSQMNQVARLNLLDTLGLFKDRIVFNYGFARISDTQDVVNLLGAAPTTTTSQYYYRQNVRNYGVVVHPIPSIAVFYANTLGIGTFTAPNNGVAQPVGLAYNQEVGVRWRGLDNRLNARVSYYQIAATNGTVPSFPNNPAAPNVVIGDTLSHGFDGNLSWEVNRNITLLATFADYKAHVDAQPANVNIVQPGLVGPAAYGVNAGYGTPNAIAPTPANTLPTAVPVDDDAEKTASLYARYAFTDGPLKGFDFAVGVDYECKRAITENNNQIFFGYVPGRTLVNLFADYNLGRHWIFSANIDNVLDHKYIWTARSVNVIEPGTPLNFKGTVTYNF